MERSALSWMFDALIIAVGAGLAVAIGGTFVTGDRPDTSWFLAAALGVPLIIVTTRFGFVVSGRGDGVEVGFDAAVLVTLVLTIGSLPTMAIWVIAHALTALTESKRYDVRAFNFGLATINGVVAVAVMQSIGHLGATTPSELASVGAGCAAYFGVDYLLSATSAALEKNRSPLAELRQPDGLLAGLVFIGVDSLGYLAAIVLRSLPAWTGLLLAGPLVTILVASRALSRAGEHRRRLSALFEAAAAVQGISSTQELASVLRRHASQVTATGMLQWRTKPPLPREIGLQLPEGVTGPGDATWLVSPGPRSRRSSATQDRRALAALVGVARETTARLALLDRLAQQARRDTLTGLPNRLLLTEKLQLLLPEGGAEAELERPGDEIAVIHLDLDGFKSVNDRFGHAAGDELLKRVAHRLVALIGPDDCVARMGGDEFALMLTAVSDRSALERICAQVLTAVRVPVNLSGHSVVIGASMGVCTTADARDPSELMRNADMAMYRAKTQGKNEFVIYQPSLGDERIRRLELIEALRTGLSTELVLHYQPLIDLQSGQIIGAEALVRWRHDGQLVRPDSFIPAAESSGLILPLGHWVLQQVMKDVAQLSAAAGRPLDIAVNMSAHQLRDVDFPGRVRAASEAFGDCRLVLEMTETVLVEDDDHTVRTLHQLTEAGARLAIDDFGVGYSSIGYLQHLPISVVKIDRSFIREIEHGPRSKALVDAILAMGAALSLDVIAEGIERPEQAALLRDFGCSQGQGFYYARPQPLDGFLSLLATGLRAEADH